METAGVVDVSGMFDINGRIGRTTYSVGMFITAKQVEVVSPTTKVVETANRRKKY